MKELIKSAKDFKIIPNNFKSSGGFKLLEVNDETIKIELILANDADIEDYKENSNVEIFGVNDLGLVYFETKILNRKENIVSLAVTPDFSIIQRREYSRVSIGNGQVVFKDLAPNFVLDVEDISAGGIKLISKEPLEADKNYALKINLSNNMQIECELQPVRITKTQYRNKPAYIISGKFVNLENADRIVLVQYAFKIKMEEQNKENN